MRTFLRTILLFTSLPLLGAGWLLMRPGGEAYLAREYVQRHCRNGWWLHQRLADSSAIDIALLGSSRMMCGVSDYLLEEALRAAGDPSQVANLGLCRYGRTLTWVLTRRLMARSRPPAWLIIEVRVEEDRFSHPDFPYLAEGRDLLGAYPFWHQRYAEQLGQGLIARFQAWRHASLGLGDSLPPYAGRHSFVPGGHSLTLRPEHQQLSPLPLRTLPTRGPDAWTYREHQRFPWHYLEHSLYLAQAHGTRVAFLYLPGLQTPAAQRPLDLAAYQAWGPVWVPPASILSAETHWMDPDHLNEAGATRLSQWVAQQILDQTEEKE